MDEPTAGHRGRSQTPTAVASGAEDEDFGQCERIGMGDGQKGRGPAHGGESTGGAAMKLQLRRTAEPDDLDVAPQHATRVSRAKRLHGRLLRSKPAREVNGRDAAARAVGDFSFGEHTAQEPLAVALDAAGDAVDVGDVQSESDDGRHARPSA